MRNILLVLVLFPLLVSNQAHRFYVSTTQIEYSEEEYSLQIISRIFTDDLEQTLEDIYNFRAFLKSKKESPKTNEYLADYYQKHLHIYVNGEQKTIDFVGKIYEDNSTKSYLEIKDINEENLKYIKIRNLLLYEKFKNQKNIIHLRVKNFKKSIILTADYPSQTITIQ